LLLLGLLLVECDWRGLGLRLLNRLLLKFGGSPV
jgi:hypothetical protein